MRAEAVRLGQWTFRAEQKTNEKKENTITTSNDSVVQNPVKKSSKALPIVTAAVAVASLGFAIAANKKKPPAGNSKEIIEALQKEIEALKTKLADNTATEELMAKYNKLLEEIKSLKESGNSAYDAKINELSNSINQIGNRITHKLGFTSSTVEVNGKQMPFVADMINKVEGGAKAEMEKSMRTEAAKRIFGLSEGLKEVANKGMLRIPTSEVRPHSSTGGMSAVPKELAATIAALLAGHLGLQVALDSPLYLGRYEADKFDELVRDEETGELQFVRKTFDKDGNLIKTELIDTMEEIGSMDLDILTDNLPEKQHVRILKGKDSIIPLDMKVFRENISDENWAKIEEVINSGKEYENNGLFIKKGLDNEIKAYVKVQNILYDNQKFFLDTPAETYSYDDNGILRRDPINIYSNKTYSSGETERFAYFGKYFYEQMYQGKNFKQPLSTDVILGNDWQSGFISAMVRMLTLARKYYGLAPDIADKIQNTPIISDLHNAMYSGGIYNQNNDDYTVQKLLNVMFGEHAATVVQNAWMPNLHVDRDLGNSTKLYHEGLPEHLQNALTVGHGLNPQMMLAAYSDYVVPVSKGYVKDITKNDFMGGAIRDVFALRAHEGNFYGKDENIRILIENNGLKIPARAEQEVEVTENGENKTVKVVRPSMVGIPNGVGKSNNTLTEKVAQKIEKALGLEEGLFKAIQSDENALVWHNKNKQAALSKVIADIDKARNSGGNDNPMKIALPEMTDLTGVTEKTPIFVSAGRIVDQKGIDIFAAAIKEYFEKYYKEGDEIPVFYLQGIGGEQYRDMFLNAKKEVAKINPVAAQRMVFAGLFSEAGRYDCAKMLADFTAMPSWFEPCGLVHKEIGTFSGAIPVVNRIGGLPEELIEGRTVIVSEFTPKKNDKATPEEVAINGSNFAKAIAQAIDLYNRSDDYGTAVTEMLASDFDWLTKGGSGDKYMALFENLGVVSANIRDQEIV